MAFSELAVSLTLAERALPISTVGTQISVFSSTTVNVNLTGFRLSGSVTVDGLPIGGCAVTIGGTEHWGAKLTLVDTTDPDRQYSLPMNCGAATTFAGWVGAGTYRYQLAAGSAPHNLPMETSDTWRGQTISVSNHASTVLSLSSVPIEFSLLAGGVTPLSRCVAPSSTPKAIFRFDYADALLIYSSKRLVIPCSATSFSVTTRVLEGRYHLSVTSSESNLPVTQELGLFIPQAGMPRHVIDVPRPVSGTIVANGMPASCTAGTEVGEIRFKQGSRVTHLPVQCGAQGTLTFSGFVPLGRQTIEIDGANPESLEPPTTALPSFPTSLGVFDVQ